MVAASLIDTNVLVYWSIPVFRKSRQSQLSSCAKGLSTVSIRIPHQAVLEFMAVVNSGQNRHRTASYAN